MSACGTQVAYSETGKGPEALVFEVVFPPGETPNILLEESQPGNKVSEESGSVLVEHPKPAISLSLGCAPDILDRFVLGYLFVGAIILLGVVVLSSPGVSSRLGPVLIRLATAKLARKVRSSHLLPSPLPLYAYCLTFLMGNTCLVYCIAKQSRFVSYVSKMYVYLEAATRVLAGNVLIGAVFEI